MALSCAAMLLSHAALARRGHAIRVPNALHTTIKPPAVFHGTIKVPRSPHVAVKVPKVSKGHRSSFPRVAK